MNKTVKNILALLGDLSFMYFLKETENKVSVIVLEDAERFGEEAGERACSSRERSFSGVVTDTNLSS